MSDDFNIEDELEKLKKQTKTIRKTKHYNSRIDRYKGEVLKLNKAGASIAEIQRFLRGKRIKLVHSTVSRWLKTNG